MLALTEIFRHPSLETPPGDSIHPYIAQAIGRCASPTPLQKSCVWLCSEQSTGIGFSCWSPVILNRCERGQLLLWSPPPPTPKSECSSQPGATRCVLGPQGQEVFREQFTGRGWQSLLRDPISPWKDLLVTGGCLPWHSLLAVFLLEKNFSTPICPHSTCCLSFA